MAIIISDIQRDRVKSSIETSVSLKIDGGSHRFKIVHQGDHQDLDSVPPTYDPFLLFLLIPAMARNQPIIVEGSIDAQRLSSLKTDLQSLLKSTTDRWRPIEISADAQMNPKLPDLNKGAAMGMSCGIDSLYTFKSLNAPDTPTHLKPKILLHNNVGAHPDESTFNYHRTHIQNFANQVDLPLITTSVDLSPYYDGRFVHTHTLRNAAAAMSLEHLFYSFAYPKSDSGNMLAELGRGKGIGPMEPATLPQLNTSANIYFSHGHHASRLRKSNSVMRTEVARQFLTVCTRKLDNHRSKINCGWCYKCARELFFADAHGFLDDFRNTFDLNAFHANRNRCIRRLVRHSVGDRRTDDDSDMLSYLYSVNYNLPLWSRPFKHLIGAPSMRHSFEKLISDPAQN